MSKTKTTDGVSAVLSTDGLGDWVSAATRQPEEHETIDGRVPAIDEDGYLVFAMLIGGTLSVTSGIGIRYWMPVKAPNVGGNRQPERSGGNPTVARSDAVGLSG